MTGDSIAVNGRFLRAVPTGLHRVARCLTAAAIDAGLQLDLIAPPGVTDELLTRPAGGTKVRGGRRSDQLWEQTALPRLARGRPLLSLTNTAPLLAGNSIVMVHDLAPLIGPQWFVPAMRAYAAAVIVAARRAKLVLTVSQPIADQLTDHGVRGPIRIIRQSVSDLEPATADEIKGVRETLGIKGDFVVMVGWADPRKDATTAVAAHRRALRSRDHTLVLVGLQHPVFAPIAIQDDLPSIVRTGWVAERDLAALFTGARAVLCPSRYEGFGRTALEAWRCRTPALISDLPAMREATRDRGSYLPVGDIDAWADAIVAALDGEIPTPDPDPWNWADAATQLIETLKSVT